jgi:hypothetical protein
MRAPRQDWMTGIDWNSARLELLMLGLSITYVLVLGILIIAFLGGQL